MNNIFTIYVEKRPEFNKDAQELLHDFRSLLGLRDIESVRLINKYDIDGISKDELEAIKYTVLSEKNTDVVYEENIDLGNSRYFVVEYHEGQYDQRADSASQCIQLITQKDAPLVKSGKVIAVYGSVTDSDMEKIKAYYINAVDSRESSLEKKTSIMDKKPSTPDVEIIEGFTNMDEKQLKAFIEERGLALNLGDILLIRDYFKEEKRNPTITEIKVLDTYWSDHCRHTTFSRIINNVEFEAGTYSEPVKKAFDEYKIIRESLYVKREKPMTLMDMAVIGAKKLSADGKLDKLDKSEEINACSIEINVDINGKDEKYLLMFKNETHNHPTEIEPFGGAATCLGGAIRDPLSGRSYVFGAMRITGCADPRVSLEKTLNGKLPQRKITKEAARGYSSYGNQIGLASGYVREIYDPGYVAKRMEVGAVLGAAPKENVIREVPCPGDKVILVGGRTGRDGVGGASGSSKEHNEKSIDTCSSEVQKGNAPTERKLQRLFRKKEVTTLIKRCNDFGAGGVSVAVGELADGLNINLDMVKKKYEGLDGTEIAISESQERMAVVVRAEDSLKFIKYCEEENLEAVEVAEVTEKKYMRITWRGKEIVNLSRAFLDTNGAHTYGDVKIAAPSDKTYFDNRKIYSSLKSAYKDIYSDLNCVSQKGLMNIFDSTIGGNTVLMPYGGKNQRTQQEGMVFKIPVENGETTTTALMAHGFNSKISEWSPFHGALYSVVESVTKLIAMGGDTDSIYLSFQEYFEKLGNDPQKWGKPFAALLGGLEAQIKLGAAAIGGKDSMSGTFKDLNVPPTLISFAVTTGKVDNIVSAELKRAGSRLVVVNTPINKDCTPDFAELSKNYELIHELIKDKKVLSSAAIGYGGILETIGKMSFGNGVGVKLDETIDIKELQKYTYGSVLLEIPSDIKVSGDNVKVIGQTTEESVISHGSDTVSVDELLKEFDGGLEEIFNQKYRDEFNHLKMDKNIMKEYRSNGAVVAPSIKVAKPRVLIPIFPGTNCEYDCQRAFEKAGGQVETMIFNNLSADHIKESIEVLKNKIDKTQIIMLPGGFSAGDEPDGSGKFINAIFRNEAVKEAVMKMLKDRDGLMLGICNGFQALIKLGLVPYGEIRNIDVESPTLTHNLIGSHESRMVNTKIVSNKSPWLSNCNTGDVFTVPISHGEGRFYGSEEVVKKLFENGQVATQYVDFDGNPTYDIEFNPNGSVYGIEGITSIDGRIFGKMAHSERIGNGVIKNVPGEKDMKLFESGIAYFK